MRYPLEDLVAASGLTEHGLAKKVGLKGTSLRRAREMGLTADAADRYAVRAGLHPYLVWPEMADHARQAAAQAEQEALERRRRIARESARRRYWESVEVREKRKAAARAWRADNQRTLRFHPSRQPEARVEQSRAYYARHAEEIKARQRARHRARKENAA